MNIFIIILVFFAVLGFADKAIGGRFGLEKEIDIGLSTMGTCAVYIIGIYCVGSTFIENNADAIAGFVESFPMDPSIIIGCILAPDLGGFPIALGLAGDSAMGYFSGVIIGSCLGQFISFQLPVIFNMLDNDTKQKMIRGFVYGIAAIPAGLIIGGLIIGIDLNKLILNISIIIAVCLIMVAGFIKFPSGTEKILLAISAAIKLICQILFILVIVGLFIPGLHIVPIDTVLDGLYLVIKMTVVVCGGLVFVKILMKVSGGMLARIGKVMGTDRLGAIGLVLNTINSLTVVPHLPNMNENGKVINAAYCVSGAYLLGGQLAFVLLVAPTNVFIAFLASKLTAGILSIVIALRVNKRKK